MFWSVLFDLFFEEVLEVRTFLALLIVVVGERNLVVVLVATGQMIPLLITGKNVSRRIILFCRNNKCRAEPSGTELN